MECLSESALPSRVSHLLKFGIQVIGKFKNSLNILAIFPGKALCAVEARPEKAGGILSRVSSVVLGLRKRLAQQALNGHIARRFPQFRVSQLPEYGISRKETE